MEKPAEPPRAIRDLMAGLMSFIRRGRDDSNAQAPDTLRIARYNLILMDRDGQVVWTGEWYTGKIFEFGPRYSLWIFCKYTNHSNRAVEIAEYEIELMDEEGMVVNRFGNMFGDAIIVEPGQEKVFSGRWKL